MGSIPMFPAGISPYLLTPVENRKEYDMTTLNENKQFAREVMSSDGLLEAALDWICNHMQPEDVFDDEDLENWAVCEGYVWEYQAP